MRPKAVCAILVASFLLAVPFSMASARHEGSCAQQCADQWRQDKLACQQVLQDTMSSIDSALATCLAQAHGGAAVARCHRVANTARHNAQTAFRRCVSEANQTAWNCTRSCSQSHFQP
jgi:hypothetical protein